MTEPKLQFKLVIFHPYSEPYNPLDDDVIVHVFLDDGRVFHGWFFTPRRILALMEKDRVTGESANGTYFWTTDCVIIREISQETCELAVADLLKSDDDFFEAFTDITEGMRDADE